MDKLFLIDAYAIIYRSYYAFIKSPRINSKGLNTSAILGFCNTLHEILNKEKPKYVGVAFDPHGATFRSDAYPEYKAQREKTPEDILVSVPIIQQILEAMHIPVLIVEGYEADDVIGTLALQSVDKNVITYMLTPDKDYGQLVKNTVKMYRPRHGGGYEIMGIDEIKEKYQIDHPEKVIDLLALMGDSADNFPGCPGVGEKTAIKLINEFGSVDNLLNNTQQLKGALKKKVEEHIKDIQLSKFLATIKTDVPITLQLDDFQVTAFNVPHDSSDNVGYMVQHDGVTFCLITDVGHVTDEIKSYIGRANYLVLEANHDLEMLAKGKYPVFLKERILSEDGHLSNKECGMVLAENATPLLKKVWLCHLSEENNHPELARITVEQILRSHGIIAGEDFGLEVLKRKTPTGICELK